MSDKFEMALAPLTCQAVTPCASHEPRPLTCARSSHSLCFAVTSVLAGRVGDIFGRRMTLLAGALIFTVGGLFQTFTTGFKVMVFGRILSGFGVGFLSYVSSRVLPPCLALLTSSRLGVQHDCARVSV